MDRKYELTISGEVIVFCIVIVTMLAEISHTRNEKILESCATHGTAQLSGATIKCEVVKENK